jgi:hypothetical protein
LLHNASGACAMICSIWVVFPRASVSKMGDRTIASAATISVAAKTSHAIDFQSQAEAFTKGARGGSFCLRAVSRTLISPSAQVALPTSPFSMSADAIFFQGLVWEEKHHALEPVWIKKLA